MPDHPKVTALVPAWQAEAFIQPTLDALSAQTVADLAVIVSVDLSDDATYEICKAHQAQDPRFSVYRQTSRRLGYAGNCNFLLDRVQSPYALLAFHDDLLAPAYIEQIVGALEARPNAVLGYSDVVYTNESGRSTHWVYTELDAKNGPAARAVSILNKEGRWYLPNRGVFRMDAARQIGGIKTNASGDFSPDWAWLFHMALLGPFVRVPKVLCNKRSTAHSHSKQWAYTARQWHDAAASCLEALWDAPLPLMQKINITNQAVASMKNNLREATGKPS
jgi:glycosyltransferase involved in cell wall biosynthesis